MGDLLSAYNENRDVFGDDFNIPESNNGIPDILDEIKPQLFKATGKDKYNEAFKELFKKYGMMPGYYLAKLGYYGTIAYINSDKGDEGIRTQLKNKMIKKAVPGMLVAGPNCILGDAIAKNLFINEPAAKCYIDSREVYSVNEVDIYWNSALIYLMSKTVMK